MSYAEALKANRRLCILKLLMEDNGHSNESVLELAMRAMGHNAGMSRDYVRGLLRDLETLGCITVEFFNDKVMVARLLERGACAARGDITCEGVARPGFGG